MPYFEVIDGNNTKLCLVGSLLWGMSFGVLFEKNALK
jgi:hypothetical protein